MPTSVMPQKNPVCMSLSVIPQRKRVCIRQFKPQKKLIKSVRKVDMAGYIRVLYTIMQQKAAGTHIKLGKKFSVNCVACLSLSHTDTYIYTYTHIHRPL